MTSAYAVTSALLAERIELLLTVAVTVDRLGLEPARFGRLAAGALALVQQHAVDDKGRCRFCTCRRRWRRIRARPCTVYSTFSACLTQPDDMVQRLIADLLRYRDAGDAAAMTRPMPRLSDW